MSDNTVAKQATELPFYVEDPFISLSAYVNPSTPWVAGRAYSVVPLEPLRPTLFPCSAFNGNKFHFYCVIRGTYTGILIDSQQAATFTQGYPRAYMVKVKSQAEALRLYNASLKARDVEVVRRAPHFICSLRNPWAIICILMLVVFVVVSYRL